MFSDSRGITRDLVQTLIVKLRHMKQSMFVQKVTFFVNERVLSELISNTVGNIGGHVLPPNRVSGDNRKKVDHTAPDSHEVFWRKDLGRGDVMASSFTLENPRLIHWDCLGFYPAEFEFTSYLKSFQGRVDTNKEHDREVQCLMNVLVGLKYRPAVY